jgi:25S rRNA (uracil2634-N3)-methyltransferase
LPRSSGPKVLFSIDARKLGAQGGGGKEIKVGYPRKERKIPAWKAQQHSQQQSKPPSGPWDVICFNFPHVGGLSTDVNRQVRANQELLVGFFKSCVPLLSAAPEPVDSDDEWEDDEDEDEDEDVSDDDGEDAQSSGKAVRTGPGQILVSLFEAEPYTLWNIKDLARHAGLQVVTSFRFPWTSYEGYSHARTLGEVEGKNGGRGGWRGEDREARMYVFEAKREDPLTGKKKRPRGDSSDSE